MNFDMYRVFYDFNLDYSIENNKEYETNMLITQVMNDFIHKYNAYFADYTFILEYQDDVFGLITYMLFKNLRSIFDFNFKLTCKNKIKLTKSYLNKKDIIRYKKAIKTNSAIYFNCFNPLFYVINSQKIFNNLSKDKSLIANFTPEKLLVACDFYQIHDKKILNPWDALNCKYFSNFCNRNFSNEASCCLDTYKIFYYNDIIPKIKVYNLTGTQDDFPIFDKILNEKNTIIFYNCPEDKINFIKSNLNPYIEKRNAVIEDFNVNLPKEFIEKLQSERTNLINSFNKKEG